MAGYGVEMNGMEMGDNKDSMEYENKGDNFLNIEEENRLAFSRNKGLECG
jgi:hypothetical protein